ncbi:major capsid protein P2 [Marinobacter sp.]|uniref:major capsid protein P2 n=1 Tax=Marinobacter sp. TaxID=50741 RepID=UPI0035C6DD51
MDLVELNPFPSVPATGVATLVTNELAGRSVHGLIFEQAGTTYDRTHIDNLKIRAGQKDLLEGITGAQLQDLNDYNGLNADASYFAHFFGDPTARTIRGQHLGDLDLDIYGNDPLQIEVKNNGATAPELKVYALVSVPKKAMGIGFDDAEAATVRALIRTVNQPAAAITRKAVEIGLGSQAGAKVRALHFFHANLTSVEFRKASDVKHDNISIALNTYVQGAFARSAQAGLYTLDRIMDGNQGEAETTLQNNGRPWPFQVMLTTSAADTVTTFADVHTAIGLI